ncbi:MAG: class I SAM-dependent methyltransferase [Bacteroidota bacterium]|nr:class I SAM-dependent methyltransferase [Bacteroidota bacterium]
MDSNTNKKCMVCGSTDISTFLDCTDHFITKETFRIDTCRSCGFRFTANAPAAEQIGAYYKSEAYISHSDTHKGLINKLYHIVRNIMLGKKLKLIRQLTDGRRLLDIGCGTGHFLNYMQKNGFTCEGIEIDQAAREFGIREFGLKVDSPDMIYKKDTASTYDVITLWHVMEHLYDAGAYLSWMHQVLKPDGVLIIALPNCASLDARYYGQYWAAYDVPRHLWHFKPAVFKQFVSQYGFKSVKVKGMPFDAYYNSMMSATYAGKKGAMLQGLYTGLRSTVHSHGKPELSSSVIYLLKKTL